MRIGVDFGTTHSSAAYFDGKNVQFVPMNAADPAERLLRSLIYIDREHEYLLGASAAKRYLEEETGRPVVLEDKVVGTIENTVANITGIGSGSEPIHIVYDVTIQDDVGVQGRLLQSIKTGLRARTYKGTDVFGRFFSLEELIALILGHIRERVAEHLQTDICAAVLGRPVRFSSDPVEDQHAEDRLRRAAALAGFEDISFELEPVAAARSFLTNVRSPQRILIFDFGGGTLDFTLIQAEDPENYTILASHGILVGGDDLDSAIMRAHIAPYFGTESPTDIDYDGRPVYLAADVVRRLYQWQTIPELSRLKYRKLIERGIRYSKEAEKFEALASLVMHNYGFALFEKIEQAKRHLSDTDQTRLIMQAEAIDLDVPISRRAFNGFIIDELADARQGVRETLRQAGSASADVDVVVTTGGSSAVPSFQRMLIQELPGAQIIQSDPFASVTAGLALTAADQP